VIDHVDAHQHPGGHQPVREIDVFLARLRIARWMIVKYDDGRCATSRRLSEDLAGMHDAGIERPDRDDRRAGHAVLRVQQHDTELLGAESTAATASKASLDLSQAAYAAGRGSLVQVLDAQRLYAQALQGYAHAKGQRYLDSVLLFEAMGGDSKAWIESNAGSQP